MSRSSPGTSSEQGEDGEEELVLEGQTVVNGPNLLPNVGRSDDEREEENQ